MIEFSKVSKFYKDLVALKDINLEIDEKEFLFLIGPSGSGKTTLIKLLIKEEEPSEGNIFFYDTDISKLGGTKVSKLRREFGVVFQDFKLLPHKNLFENVSFALEVSGKNRKDIDETVKYVLDLVELSDRAEAYPDEISGGEKQKVAIARAVANNPKVLIADEPTGNLDPESSWDILNLLDKINEWGTTVIMATHGSEFVNSLGKRVVEMEKGKIVSDSISPKSKKKSKQKSKKEKDEKIEKIKPKDIKKKEEKIKKEKESEEKEFEITFTTKPKKSPPKSDEKKSKKIKGKKKKKGKDVVDLSKLKLPQKIMELLIHEGITTIKQLKSYPLQNLSKTKKLSKKDIDRIKKSLENES